MGQASRWICPGLGLDCIRHASLLVPLFMAYIFRPQLLISQPEKSQYSFFRPIQGTRANILISIR